MAFLFFLHCVFYLIFYYPPAADLGGRGAVAHPLPIFCNHLFYCNHFEELKTVLFEVALIINNAPLTYVYPNTIEICLSLNHLLFDKQLLFFSITVLTVVRTLTVLSSTTGKINHISNHFLDSWRH